MELMIKYVVSGRGGSLHGRPHTLFADPHRVSFQIEHSNGGAAMLRKAPIHLKLQGHQGNDDGYAEAWFTLEEARELYQQLGQLLPVEPGRF